MRRCLLTLTILLTAAACQDNPPTPAASAPVPESEVSSLRLYVFDGGVLQSDPTRYRLSPDEVQETALSIASYLIVHPDGILLWDAGAIADEERISPDAGVEQRVVRYDGNERFVTLAPPLADQLAASGYAG